MNDKKSSDDEFFDDNINEEFDYGEETFEMPTKGSGSSSPKKGPGKSILLLVLFLMLGGAGYFGYQFYGKEKIKMPSLISQASTKLEEKLETKIEKREQEAKLQQEKKQQEAKLKEEKKQQEARLKEEKKQQAAQLEVKVIPVPATPSALPTPAPTTPPTPGPMTEKIPTAIAVVPPGSETPVFNEKELEAFIGKAEVVSPASQAQPSVASAIPTTTVTPTHPVTTTTPSTQTITTPTVPALAATTPAPSAISASEMQKALEGQMKQPAAAHALVAQQTPSTPQQPQPTAGAVQQAAQAVPPGQQTTQGVQPTPPLATLPEKNITIQEMQKDLFATHEAKPGTTVPNAVPNPSPTSPPPLVAENKNIKDMKDQIKETIDSLTRVNQQMENNLNQIKNLDAYTREVSQTVTKLNSDISAMDNRVLALTKTANSLSKEIGGVSGEGTPAVIGKNERVIERSIKRAPIEELEVSTASRRRIESTSIYVEEPEYIVHAVIPGRAWLKSSKGQIITVTEGDSLGNYGKILVIDAASGVVLTSSGITFR